MKLSEQLWLEIGALQSKHYTTPAEKELLADLYLRYEYTIIEELKEQQNIERN